MAKTDPTQAPKPAAAEASAAAKPAEPQRQASGPRALAGMVARITKRPLGQRGFAEAGIITDWPSIVGAALARVTSPMRIAFPPRERNDGTLHLKVAGGGMATEVQHLQPQIIERINRYFGYRAVARLVLHQGRLAQTNRKPRQTRAAPDPQALAAWEDRLAAVQDPELRAMLASLGAALDKSRG